jgi:hypothetical protein
MTSARAMIALAAALACAAPVALAQEAAPANTLVELQRQFGGRLARRPLGPAGSRLTIMLMMKRDGSIFGKPRVTFSHLEGDAETRQRFINDAERAVDACLPLKNSAVAWRRDRRTSVLHLTGKAKA